MTISLLNDEQMSNKVRVEHQPGKESYRSSKLSLPQCFFHQDQITTLTLPEALPACVSR